MRSFLSFIAGILAAAGRTLSGAFSIFALFLRALSELCFRQPTLPPAGDNGEFAEIGVATAQVARVEEATIAKSWAVAKLNGHVFDIPAGRLAGWLAELDAGHAMRIANADQGGLLAAHVAGTQLFPDLPPVGTALATRRWLAPQQPELRRRPRAEPAPVDYREIEVPTAIEHVEPEPSAAAPH